MIRDPVCDMEIDEDPAKYTGGEGLDMVDLASRDERVRNVLRASEAILKIDAYCLQCFGIYETKCVR